MDTRDSKGRFTKGNPGGGRPKKQPTTREMLRTLSPQAVTRLGDLIHSDNEAVALNASIATMLFNLEYERDGKKFSHYRDDDDDLTYRKLTPDEKPDENAEQLLNFLNQFGLDFRSALVVPIKPIYTDNDN